MSPEWRARLVAFEGPLVYLVALHSAGVGLLLLAFPEWSLRFAGWAGAEPLFFPRQAGIFHFVVVLGYLGEWRRHRTVTLMVATKAIAFAFLIGAWLEGESAWSVPFSGFSDGLMGAAAAWIHRLRAEGSSTRPVSPSSS